MRKIKKSLIAVSCLFALTLTSGLATANASANATTVTTDTFAMVYGASIREGKAGEDPAIADTNGIRFTGEISAAEFEEWRNDYTVEAGTFILPYDFYKAYPINKLTCFGDINNKIYKWKDDTGATTDTQITIIHVPAEITATPNESRTGSGESVYQINGSVVNMKAENLDRKYVGVSYIKAGDEYYFAATNVDKNSRSTVTVAQNILIDENAKERDAAIAEDYVEEYLANNNNSVSAEIKGEVYVNSSTGYTKSSDLETQNITLDSVDDFMTLYENQPANMDGYDLVLNGQDNLNKSVARVDETVTLKYYYDKQVANTVIFDGSKTGEDGDVLKANNIWLDNGSGGWNDATGWQYPNYDRLWQVAGAGIRLSNDWGYHGNSSIYVDDFYANGGDGAYIRFGEFGTTNSSIELPAATNKLSLKIRTNATKAQTSDYPNQVQIVDASGKQIWGAFQIPTTLGLGEVAEVTAEFKSSFSSIKSIRLSIDSGLTSQTSLSASTFPSQFAGITWPKEGDTYRGDDNPYYIDYIQAEYEVLRSGSGNVEITEAEKNGTKTIDITTGVQSTVYSDAELGSTATATCKQLASDAPASQLVITNGQADITVAEECNYQIDVNIGSIDYSFYVLGYFQYVAMTFDDVKNDTVGTASGDGRLTTLQTIDGEHAFELYSYTNGNFAKYAAPWLQTVTLNGNVTTLCMWIYSETEKTLQPSSYGDIQIIQTNNSGRASIVHFDGQELSAGWNYVEFEFDSINADQYNAHVIKFFTGNNTLGSVNVGLIIDRVTLK